MRDRWATVCLLPLAIAGVLAAQQPLPQRPIGQQPAPSSAEPNAYTLQLNAQAVVLDIVVTNRKGEVVTSLKKDDFQIYEDKLPQVIRTFDPPPVAPPNPPIHSTADLDRLEPNAPVTLIVLDEINTRFQDEAFARYSLKRFLDKQGDKLEHPTLLGAVDLNHFTLLHDYTTSKQDLLNALEHHLAVYPWHLEGSWKAEQFNASFVALLEIAKATAGHPGHKSLVWVGRGFPPFDPENLSQQQSETLKQVIETCTNALRDARVALYTLDPAGVSTEPPEMDSDGFIVDPFNGMLDFNTMAQETGGHAFYGRNDVDDLIATSTRDGASFYAVSYTPAIPRTDTRAFHSIRVVMKNPDLHAETREGYYSKPEAPPVMKETAGKQANQRIFDLAVAIQSAMVYDGVHMTIKRVAGDPNQFRITLNSGDLIWQEGGPQKLITKITVVAESFDKKGEPLHRAMKVSTLQVGESSTSNVPDSPTVSLFTSIPTQPPATRIRFLIQADEGHRLGALNFALSGKNATGEGSN
jgi:VWFA-related protein